MSRHEETLVRLTCDGCGIETTDDSALWRHVTVTQSRVNGGAAQSKSLDLCPECVKQVNVPGLQAVVV